MKPKPPPSHGLVREQLSSILTGMGALYIASALFQTLAQPQLQPAWVLLSVAATTGLLFGIRFSLRRWEPSNRWNQFFGVLVVGLVLASSLLHVYLLSSSSGTTLNFALLAIGITAFLLPVRLVHMVLVCTLGYWLVLAWLFDPTPAWIHFSFGLFAAVGVRLHLELRRANLQEANRLLEQALESAANEIRKRERAEEQLRESQERHALMAQGSRDGLWDWSLRKGQFHVSPRWKIMVGLDPDAEIDAPDGWFALVDEEDRPDLKLKICRHIESQRSHFECEYRIVKPNGSRRWMLCRGMAVRDHNGKAYRIAGSQTDITRRKKGERDLWRAALHDSLTGLPNRSLFLEQVQGRMLSLREHPDLQFAVLFIDLDRFKVINDSLGHMVGDELLKATARRLREALRESDTVSRFGGDEFAILLGKVRDLSDAIRITDRLRRRLSAPLDLNGRRVFTSASIGIVMSNPKYSRPEEMLRDADIAMYRAKNGKALHAVFDEEMHARAVDVMQIEQDLRLAYDRGEFELCYQPLVSLSSGQVTSVEALLRWQHPERGLLTPDQFIGNLEETGLVVPVGRWALREACRQIGEWCGRHPQNCPLSVSVNLSPRQFMAPDLPRQVANILKETKLDPRLLVLEVTEDATMNFDQASYERFARLRAMGVRIHLDDFGTGYSSLSYLHRFRFDTVKIDRSFSCLLEGSGENHEVVRAMADLIHNLRMEVVFEGLETASQVAVARQLGCEYGQGYYFSRPVPPEELERLLDVRWQSAPESRAPIPIRPGIFSAPPRLRDASQVSPRAAEGSPAREDAAGEVEKLAIC